MYIICVIKLLSDIKTHFISSRPRGIQYLPRQIDPHNAIEDFWFDIHWNNIRDIYMLRMQVNWTECQCRKKSNLFQL